MWATKSTQKNVGNKKYTKNAKTSAKSVQKKVPEKCRKIKNVFEKFEPMLSETEVSKSFRKKVKYKLERHFEVFTGLLSSAGSEKFFLTDLWMFLRWVEDRCSTGNRPSPGVNMN